MSKFEFNIYPNLKKSMLICKAEIQVREVILFESVTVIVYLKNENDCLVDTRVFLIEGEEYALWQDDKYLLDLIKQKLQEPITV